jgi:hypothetical protein
MQRVEQSFGESSGPAKRIQPHQLHRCDRCPAAALPLPLGVIKRPCLP